ncbi:hypothetical protein EGH82_13460 [Vibrio ponticus]|uniref:Uncharacterized protein n=1 Tax=Vibrio ponticus TaxID=265668 RepID=A0A3N3DYM6_9VIBR|nr:hypothetical protein [Vibrio ponticus]ROV59502.1 hypothetical protein EGH82_13460 [Vibrio ponticus]
MNDDSLAPFVDALASSLIVMVLVCIFFLIQTSATITSAAKMEAVVEVEDQAYTPIVYREIFGSDLENKEIKYVVNFKLEPQLVEQIRAQLNDVENVKVIIESRDSEKKSAVNIMRFLAILDLPEAMKITTEIVESKSVISKVRWETN